MQKYKVKKYPEEQASLASEYKIGRAKSNRVYQENRLVTVNTLFQKPKRQLDKWISPDGQYKNQIDYVLCSQRWGSSIESAKTKPGAVSGSDHEHLTTKVRLKFKRVGKTTRPLRYDLNKIPYD